MYDYPHDHPWISGEEKELIAAAVAKDRVTFDPHQGAVRAVSFSEGVRILAQNPAFWGLCLAGFCALGVFFDQSGSFFGGFCSLAVGAAIGAFVLIPIVVYERRVKQEKREKAALAPTLGEREVLSVS